MKITRDRSVEGKKLVHVIFEREIPEAHSPVIEVVYQIRWPSDFTVTGDNTFTIIPLSTTRTDTRQPVEITEEENEAVLEAAINYVASLDSDWW